MEAMEVHPMPEPIDWSLTTFEGNRRRQHEAFRALSFREKLVRLEQMGEVARIFAADKPRPHGNSTRPAPSYPRRDGEAR